MKRFFMCKSISIVVMIAFLSMICFAYPGHTEQAEKTEKQEKVKTVAAEAETEAAAEVNEFYSRDDANVIEDEGYPGGKKKKFPWLLVVGGVVVTGVVLYFLVFKTKKYELTVTLGNGVTGTPNATQKYKKGTVVSYNYSLQSGYEQLEVKVDGVVQSSASGAITMDGAHSISVTAIKSVTGTYQGTTSQGYAITLRVTKVGGISTVTYFRIQMKGYWGSWSLLGTVWGNPNSQISNYSFSYAGYYLDFDGTFSVNGTTTVSGTWDMHWLYGGRTYTGSGTYNASKTAKAAGIPSRLAPGQEKTSVESTKR